MWLVVVVRSEWRNVSFSDAELLVNVIFDLALLLLSCIGSAQMEAWSRRYECQSHKQKTKKAKKLFQ